MIRKPIVSGQFYPAAKHAAEHAINECLAVKIDTRGLNLPKTILAGIVPHAGWICSGAVAGDVFQAIQSTTKVDTFVLFGAVHRYGLGEAAIFDEGEWETPLGRIAIDSQLARELLAETKLIRSDPNAHLSEHSLEVQVPFIQYLFPKAKILPIMVPPGRFAPDIGEETARAIEKSGKQAVCIGSSDLTHYGPNYNFTPHGIGAEGIRWAMEKNDAGLLSLIEKMDATGVLEYASKTQSACGAGAISATISAAKTQKSEMVKILRHTNSFEVLSKKYGDMGADSVGYASVIFGK